jgi:hypothetical protein
MTDVLTSDFEILHLNRAPTADEAANLASLNQQVTAGQITMTQAVESVCQTAINEVSVANEVYQFFTGATPSLAGLQYLVHGGGNSNDLTSAYYAQFNLENRYINFAANLGVSGAGAAAFAAAYGSLTFSQAVAQAYNAIIGDTVATAAGYDVNAAVAAISAQQSYFQSYGDSTAVPTLGAKAAMVGYIIAEATKAGLGAYAVAEDAFLHSMIAGGASYNVDLIGTYAPSMGGTPMGYPPGY